MTEAAARLATEADGEAVEALLASALDEKADQRGGRLLAACELQGVESAVSSLLADPDELVGEVLVGLFDEVVLGVALVAYETTSEGDLLGRLVVFSVDPEARSVGVGEAMMVLAQERARSAGCSGLDAYALPGDRNTKNFFESFGLKARLLVVHTEL